MSEATFYFIDTRTNSIVNAVSTSGGKRRAEEVAQSMIGAEFLRVDANPPLAMLQKYRYWNERP